jgi:hypothetical protein
MKDLAPSLLKGQRGAERSGAIDKQVEEVVVTKTVFYGGSIALLMTLAGVTIPACSSSLSDHSASSQTADEHSGSLGLDLTIGGGVVLSTINYTISGNGITPITGTIPVDAGGATASILIGALPAGTGYTVTLSSDDGKGTKCGGTASFNVTAAQTVGVSVPLTCGTATTRGNANINGTFNSCPEITSLIVAPLSLDVGGNINVSAAGSDVNSDPLTFAWTAGNGTFANPTAATTTYKCTVKGAQTLTISVDDGKGCVSTLNAAVNCTAASVCGNSVIEASGGEQCDPPNGTTCDTSCQNIAVKCGNGIVQPSGNEQCDPPNGTTCSTTCTNIVCGDGKVEGAEQCEPPNTATCDATCKNVVAKCGDGKITPPETCEPPNTTTCDANCKSLTPDPCPICTAASCSGPATACTAHEPGCDSVLACVKSSGCAVGSIRDGAECYCGTLDNDTCFNSFDATVPQGPCKAAINAAAGTTTPLQVGQVFFDTSTSVGAAMQEVSCQLRSCQVACKL